MWLPSLYPDALQTSDQTFCISLLSSLLSPLFFLFWSCSGQTFQSQSSAPLNLFPLVYSLLLVWLAAFFCLMLKMWPWLTVLSVLPPAKPGCHREEQVTNARQKKKKRNGVLHIIILMWQTCSLGLSELGVDDISWLYQRSAGLDHLEGKKRQICF